MHQQVLDTLSSKGSLRGLYAKHILQKHVEERAYLRIPRKERPLRHRFSLPEWRIPAPSEQLGAAPDLPSGKVCIIGAGAAGLSVALQLKAVGIHDIDIFEASDRVGGRVYTFSFPEPKQAIPHNYYDVGAMRIPHIPLMQPLFTLITLLGLETSVKPYILNEESHQEPNMSAYEPITYKQISDLLAPFSSAISTIVNTFSTETFDKAFEDLVQNNDDVSTREWLRLNAAMDFAHIEQSETFDTSTGLFDQAFTETILDYVDFDTAGTWSRLEGGMEVLTKAMRQLVETATELWPGIPIQTNSTVTALTDNDNDNTISVTVTQEGKANTNTYATVFNTTTMGCLQRMDISGLNLGADLLTGIRALSYDRACKVAVMFTDPWWQSLVPQGGSSTSDLPIRSVVYPSWNDGSELPAVLIASYSWAQDATRMGSLISNETQQSTDPNDPVLVLTLQNLAKLWSSTPNAPTYEQLQQKYLGHHAYAWSHDPNTAGAFALFGPGQFKYMYPQFRSGACKNKFFMAGECTSAHHAWIVGALDSATLAVSQFLAANGKTEALAQLKKGPWAGGKNALAEELDETVLHTLVQLDAEGH
ncbi:hypothetical protein MMC19_001741 [Ptychographa xylographoides]|nr:hypothetical protein [Ptychographa xylographoides]